MKSTSPTEILSVRLSKDERKIINAAAKRLAKPGDRGGASSWVRRVALAEAKKSKPTSSEAK